MDIWLPEFVDFGAWRLRCATAIETELLQMQAETGQDGAEPQTTPTAHFLASSRVKADAARQPEFRDEAVLWRQVGQRLFMLSKH